MKHFLNIIDCTADELNGLLDSAARLKSARQRGIPSQALLGKVVAMIFEKPSLRTRVSFETAVAHLGGTSLFLPGQDVGLGWRESLADFSRTMSRYVDAMVFRVLKHATLDGVVASATVPVVNGLSDQSHPCQALADLLTIREHCGGTAGKKVVFVGDGNNVARSLAVGCVRLGAEFVLACPAGYEFNLNHRADFTAMIPSLRQSNDPLAAVQGADIIYSDVWTSMGQESEREQRLKRFAGFQVNAKLLSAAKPDCKVLHCLPANRGEEITDDVLDGPHSAVFDQAENRLHAQKAVLEWLMDTP